MKTVSSESAVKARYANAARQSEPALCCPVDYEPERLKVLPAEVVEKDYGCGDPSRHLNPGETVLDLGSGAGKICFIAAQAVGPTGRVIGVDMTDEMLEVARRNAPIVAERLGYGNVEFRKGRIQDLGLDLEALEERLQRRPVSSVASFLELEEAMRDLRAKRPLVEDESIDVVVSNCVLNLVDAGAKCQMFLELRRVLRRGGRAVISDIVSDEEVPEAMQADPELWSGCISGAMTEEGFLRAFEVAGFDGVQILKRDERPWRTVQGIEFRSVTVQAFKPEAGEARDRKQSAIYLGPFKEVATDMGHRMERGRRYAISDRTRQRLARPPYKGLFALLDPAIEAAEAPPFDDAGPRIRSPRETKGPGSIETSNGESCCASGGCC